MMTQSDKSNAHCSDPARERKVGVAPINAFFAIHASKLLICCNNSGNTILKEKMPKCDTMSRCYKNRARIAKLR